MSNTEEYIKLLHKEMEQFIDEGYERLDQQQYEMQELGLIMYDDYNYYIINPEEYEKDKKICELENEVERLEHRLANCIEPKFKIGQEVWGIVPKTFWNKDSYIIKFKVKAYIPDNNGIVLMLEDGITNIHYSYEYQVFATKEEALKKLEEMKSE